jgi:hypothetical protein
LYAVLAGVALSGCALFGGQTGQDRSVQGSYPPECKESATSMATDQVSAIGISANDFVASLPPLGGALHLYHPDMTDSLTLSLTSPSAARNIVVSMPDLACRTRLSVDVVATLLTDDGLFDASVPVTLEAEAPNNWRLQGERKLSEIAGTYDWSVFPLNQWKDPSLQIQARTAQAGGGAPGISTSGPIVGTLSLVGGDPNPSDDATPVSAAVGDWMSPGPTSFGGGGTGGGTGEVGGAGGGGETGGGNGSPGGAGGTVGGVNSSGGAGGAGGG